MSRPDREETFIVLEWSQELRQWCLRLSGSKVDLAMTIEQNEEVVLPALVLEAPGLRDGLGTAPHS